MIVDLTVQLDRTERLLRQFLAAKTGRKSEQLSPDQLALFAAAAGVSLEESSEKPEDEDEQDPPAGGSSGHKPHGRRPLAPHLKRQRIEHNLAENEKHCHACAQDLRPIGEESSERYEYLPAQMLVIEEVCKKYACACTIKTATKPAQPIEKSSAGASTSYS